MIRSLFFCMNKQNERAIKGLHIFCVNKDKGCEWQGEVNGIDSHLQNDLGRCLFEDVKLPARISVEKNYNAAIYLITLRRVLDVQLTVSTVVLLESMSSLRVNTKRCVPSFHYPVLIAVG